MKKLALVLGFLLLLTPSFVGAQTQTCSAQGYTVVFVNGIFGTETQARLSADALWYQLGRQYNSEPVAVRLGYNPSHLAGAADLAQVGAQLFNGSISRFDLDTILMQIYPEVTTRKLLLVGHSQGAFYSNDMYYYLVAHGVSDASVNVYNVGAPTAYTAGKGKYINSSGDTLLAALRAANFHILPNNIDLAPSNANDHWDGHAFAEDYLNNAGERMLTDLHEEMSDLSATDSVGECFTPPNKSIGYKTESVVFAVADPTAVVLRTGAVATAQAGAVAVKTVVNLAVGAVQFFSDTITVTTQPPPDSVKVQKTFDVTNKLYGSSLDGLSPEDKKELLGSGQGASVALALAKPKEVPIRINGGLVAGTSTEDTSQTEVPAPTSNIFPMSANGPIFGAGGGAVFIPVVDTPAPAENTEPVVPQAEATTTNDTATTTPEETPAVDPLAPLFSDTFDIFDGSGWQTLLNNPNGTYIRFAFDDGISGNCHSGGCLSSINSGSGGLGGGGHVDYMYKNTGAGGLFGAYSLWGKAHVGWGHADAMFALCTDEASGCGDSNTSIQYPNALPNDNTWHQYYFGWRQGAESVESCLMQDNLQREECVWNPSNFPLGTEFKALLLTGFSSRWDLGDSVWIDDLAALSTPQ
jgi:hypothetical protein